MRPSSPYVLALALLAAAACSSSPSAAKTDHRSPRDQQLYEEAIANGELKLGMTRAEVTQSWGKPRRKTRESYRGRKNVEIWLYPFAQVYFDHDGYVMDFRSAAG